MERLSKKNPEEVIKKEEVVTITKTYWKYIGKGHFVLREGNKNVDIIAENRTFLATESQIPKAFRDVVTPVDIPVKTPVILKVAKTVYSKVLISESETIDQETDECWNVIDSNGKIMNQQPLNKVSADKLLGALN